MSFNVVRAQTPESLRQIRRNALRAKYRDLSVESLLRLWDSRQSYKPRVVAIWKELLIEQGFNSYYLSVGRYTGTSETGAVYVRTSHV